MNRSKQALIQMKKFFSSVAIRWREMIFLIPCRLEGQAAARRDNRILISRQRLAIALLLLMTNCCYASPQQSQLSHILEQIKNIKISLIQKHDKRDSLQQELNQIETEYGGASENLQNTNQDIVKQRIQISALENNALLFQNQMETQQQALAEQLRLHYLLRRQGGVKLFLNQQDPSRFNRMLYYYQQLNLYRTDNIHHLRSNLDNIYNRQQQLYAEYQILRKLHQRQQQQQQSLAIMKINRTQLLTKINQNINDQNLRLTRLANDKKRLEETINRLKNTRLPINFPNQAIEKSRGRLPWPTRGKVMHYFGTSIQQSELQWTGELIEAPDEQPVYAVAPGTVVFSKWLEGYGLLIIINHGGGYMTLYGRNHSIYKKTGDKVSAGDLIATVGQSGGYSNPALYFGILHHTKPLDPNQWCT